MNKKVLKILLLVFLPASFCPCTMFASESNSRSQNQTDVTILHVDKYGIYAPNVVFYWDGSMSKQKVASLTAAAERLRNKKAIITYSAENDLSKDKRPLIVDVTPSNERAYGESAPSRYAGAASGITEPFERSDVERPQEEQISKSPQEVSSPEEVGRRTSGKSYSDQPREEDHKLAPREPTDEEDFQMYTVGVPKTKPPITETGPITRPEVVSFVRHILALNERKDISAVLPYYADEVDYYTRGIVNRDYIRKDLGYYYRNWDRIATNLDSDVVLIVTDEKDMRIAKFTTYFAVENAKKAISGRTENVWKLKRVGDELKIVDVKQRMVENY